MEMTMFKRQKTGQRQDDARIVALEQQVAELDRQLRAIDTEWTEMYDKFRRLHMRLAKRDQRAEDAPRDTNGDAARVEPAPTTNPLAMRLLGLTDLGGA